MCHIISMGWLTYLWIHYRFREGLETHLSTTGDHTISSCRGSLDDNSKDYIYTNLYSQFHFCLNIV